MNSMIPLIAGGVAGTVFRYLLSGFSHKILGGAFPYGTLFVNLSGCFLLGFFTAVGDGKFFLNSQAKLLLIVGFCGAFTTFSTFILETSDLLRGGQTLKAAVNVGLSVAAGFVILKAGIWLGTRIS